MISKVFYEQIEPVAIKYHLDTEDVKSAVKTALSKGIQVEGHEGIIDVIFDDEGKKIRINETFNVVDTTVEGYEPQKGDITLEQALTMKSRVKIGSTFTKEVPFSEFGRKGVYRFKQIFTQEIKNLSTQSAFNYFKEHEGEVITATVERVTDSAVILHLGFNVTSYMPMEEGLYGEEYTEGKQIKVSITKVEETTKGPKVYVTRSNKEIIKRLFETFVPEVAQGVIDVMGIAREPGNRTKIGIKSNNPNVDAKGACVGIGGARIKQINTALNGERIDIFEWSDDPVKLIAEALTPATIIAVLPDPETHKSIAIVGDDQFSLAIGKGGQNVRLASQVTGWKIDIKDETTAFRDEIHFTPNVNHAE